LVLRESGGVSASAGAPVYEKSGVTEEWRKGYLRIRGYPSIC